MRGHDHAVEAFFALWGRDDDLRAVAADGGDALAEAEVGRVRLQQRLDVGPGTAFERQPLVLGVQSEEAVVMEEAHQRRGGKPSIFSAGVDHTAADIGIR